MSNQEILELLEVRSNLLDTDEKNERIDEIEKEITEQIKNSYNNYSVDFILETLTKFGQAPNVIYDDNVKRLCDGGVSRHKCSTHNKT